MRSETNECGVWNAECSNTNVTSREGFDPTTRRRHQLRQDTQASVRNETTTDGIMPTELHPLPRLRPRPLPEGEVTC